MCFAASRAKASVFSASVGACFYNLYTMYDYIVTGRFDPIYVSSYRILLVLGIVAGLILSLMLKDNIEGVGQFSMPLLALIGGFSAETVNWILKRFVETIKILVQGSQEAIVKAKSLEMGSQLKLQNIKKCGNY